jgi:hypothetical protein
MHEVNSDKLFWCRILIKLATWMKVQSLWPPLRAAYGSHEARHEINSALAFDKM